MLSCSAVFLTGGMTSLLATAFMLAGVRGGASAQSWDPCGCLDEKSARYDDALNSLDQCDQTSTSQHDPRVTSAYENEDYCEQACYNDYYYNGGGATLTTATASAGRRRTRTQASATRSTTRNCRRAPPMSIRPSAPATTSTTTASFTAPSSARRRGVGVTGRCGG